MFDDRIEGKAVREGGFKGPAALKYLLRNKKKKKVEARLQRVRKRKEGTRKPSV